MPACYLCGRDGADTTEHVVPRCLYPGNLPSDVVTLPAHRRCNKHTERDEEAFRNHIAAAMPPGSPGHPLWDKTWKAIHRPQAKGMQREYYSEMTTRLAHDEQGLLRPTPVAARLKQERAHWVLAKIVKGLYKHQTGELLSSAAVRWRFGQAENGRERVPLPNAFDLHGVLQVQWGAASDEPFSMVWVIGFYGTVWFWVSTMPTRLRLENRRHGAKTMIWPGP